jgi:hypothetical protein
MGVDLGPALLKTEGLALPNARRLAFLSAPLGTRGHRRQARIGIDAHKSSF